MKNYIKIVFIAALVSSSFAQSDFPKLSGPYLGQTPPGDVPEIFAPGIVADIFKEHSSCAFTPDGKEVFWTRQIATMTKDNQNSRITVIMHMKQVNSVWNKPELASFNMDRGNMMNYISPDGNRLYFASSQPDDEGGKSQFPMRTWTVDKSGDGWSKQRLLELNIPVESRYVFRRMTKKGNIYFSTKFPKSNVEYPGWAFGLYRSELVDGKYQEPVALDTTINSQYLDYSFFIDPDEEYIIFASQRPGGVIKSTELYISYRKPDKTWTEAISLGEKINAYGVDGCNWPYVSPDGKYLFFMTAIKPKVNLNKNDYSFEDLQLSQISITNPESKIHWVSTGFIEKLKP